MLRVARTAVKRFTSFPGMPSPCPDGEICPGPRCAADCGFALRARTLTLILILLTVATLATGLGLLLRRRRGGERERTLSQLLDAADGLESRLRTARDEIEAIAGGGEDPVRDAMQEMLRQRLWLQQHGNAAPLHQLRSVRDSIQAARRRIDQQLLQIERARAPQH